MLDDAEHVQRLRLVGCGDHGSQGEGFGLLPFLHAHEVLGQPDEGLKVRGVLLELLHQGHDMLLRCLVHAFGGRRPVRRGSGRRVAAYGIVRDQTGVFGEVRQRGREEHEYGDGDHDQNGAAARSESLIGHC